MENFEKTHRTVERCFDKQVIIFCQTRDFGELVKNIRQTYKLTSPLYDFNKSYLAALFTDRLGKEWEEGCLFIVKKSQELGIKPQPNHIGLRVEALSCLTQLIENEEGVSV